MEGKLESSKDDSYSWFSQPKNPTKKSDTAAGTGVKGLDEILRGGLPRRHIYIIQVEPGVGKTTLAMQFLMDGRDKYEKVLYVTLSETEEDLRSSAAAHGWSLDQIEIYEKWSAGASDLDAFHTLFHPSEVDLSETIRDFLNVVEDLKPSRIVFDSLSELRLLAGDDLRYRRQIMALRDNFVSHDSTVLLLDDRSSGSEDLQIQSIAHGVIQLHDSAPDYGSNRRRIRIAKLRGVRFSGGYHDYLIEEGGMKVYPRLVAAEHRGDFIAGKVTSRIAELDSMFDGGLDRGTTTLLMGPSGTGKSTIATQYAVSLAEKSEKVAIYTFDERLSTLFQRSEGLGIRLRQFVDNGSITVTPIDPAELTPGEFAHRVKDAVELGGASMVLIDSLSGYIHSMPDARFLVLQLHELLTYLGQQGVTTLIAVTQHGLLSIDSDSELDISYLSDNVLLFRYYECEAELCVALSIFKRRSGGHERTIRKLSLSNQNGIVIGEPLQRTNTGHLQMPFLDQINSTLKACDR